MNAQLKLDQEAVLARFYESVGPIQEALKTARDGIAAAAEAKKFLEETADREIQKRIDRAGWYIRNAGDKAAKMRSEVECAKAILEPGVRVAQGSHGWQDIGLDGNPKMRPIDPVQRSGCEAKIAQLEPLIDEQSAIIARYAEEQAAARREIYES